MNPKTVMPSSDASEREVLGVCILTQSVAEVAGLVAADDFYHPAHRPIWEAMVELDKSKKPIDVLTVEQAMQKADTFTHLSAFGGGQYLRDLQSEIVSIENVAYHAGTIAKKAERRRWILAATSIAAAGYQDDDDDAFIAKAEQILIERSASRQSNEGPKHVKAYVRDFVNSLGERVARRREGLGSITGTPTGFGQFDAATAGLHRGDLVIIAGRPSMGKTSFARGIVANVVATGVPTLFFSKEMGGQEIVEQMIAGDAKIDSQRLRNGEIEVPQWSRLHKSAGDLVERPLHFEDSFTSSIDDIRSMARRWRMKHAPGQEALVILDYLQLLRASQQRGRQSNRVEEVGEISRGLKAMAKELQCPVIALSQLNRGLENRDDKRPKMSDLRDSGAIEQDADVIGFIYRDEVYNPNTDDKGVAEVIIAKQRKGPTATVKLAWLPQYARFENLSPRSA